MLPKVGKNGPMLTLDNVSSVDWPKQMVHVNIHRWLDTNPRPLGCACALTNIQRFLAKTGKTEVQIKVSILVSIKITPR
jgi:hypothetical protein